MTANSDQLQKHTAGVNQEIKKGREWLRQSKEAIKELRTKRLRSLLNFAKQASPWYKETLAGLAVDEFTEADLERVPPLDKKTLMANWDKIVTHPALNLDLVEAHTAKMSQDSDHLHLLDQFHVLSTSGSSGRRGVYVYNTSEWNQRNAWSRRSPWLTEDFRPLPISNSKEKITLAQVVITNAVYGMYASSKTYSSEYVESIYVPMTLPISEICSRLNAQKIDVLMGIPSTIYKLCLESRDGNLSINPQVVYSSGEPLYAPIRKLIKETWPNTNIFNALASSEGIYARNCAADSKEMHLNEDFCIVQPVDKDGRPTRAGETPEKLYFTNLICHTLPLIRYESPDQLVFLDKQCPCGSPLQLIEEPQGRPEFDFIYENDLFVHHLVFVTPLLHQKNIQEYQVTQTPNGAEIKYVSIGEIDTNRLKVTLSNNLIELGLRNPEINLTEVPKFDYPESGKLRRFVGLP